MSVTSHAPPPSSVQRHSPSARRPAFTIAEVLVALMLLSVGLLGMAGSSALAVRSSSAAARERRAIQRAEGRIAALSAGGCAAAASGSAIDPVTGFDERWTVSPVANGVVAVDAQVRWVGAGRGGALLLRGAVLC
jgi:Tfp pilus assembly protein PilV